MIVALYALDEYNKNRSPKASGFIFAKRFTGYAGT